MIGAAIVVTSIIRSATTIANGAVGSEPETPTKKKHLSFFSFLNAQPAFLNAQPATRIS
jgi:hypothetical protein